LRANECKRCTLKLLIKKYIVDYEMRGTKILVDYESTREELEGARRPKKGA
jgi:hypothetical protein